MFFLKLLFLLLLISNLLIAFDNNYTEKSSNSNFSSNKIFDLDSKDNLLLSKNNYRRKRTERIRRARKKFTPPHKTISLDADNVFHIGQEVNVLYNKKEIDNKVASIIDFLIYKNSGKIELKIPNNILLNYSASAKAKMGTTNKVEVKSLYLNYSGDSLNLTVGFQEIPWGETFGFQIADIINPKDFSNPMDPERIPVFTINSQYYIGNFTIEGLLTPFPRNNILPSIDSPFNPFPETPGINVSTKYPAMNKSMKDFEYGGKIGLFFDSGFDTSFFYLHHWNRNILMKSEVKNFELYISPVKEKMHSIGGSFSYSLSKVVFRGDSVYHLKAPFPTEKFGQFELINYWETILGTDLTLETGWTFGLQGQYNKYKTFSLSWGGLSIRKDFFYNRIRMDIMGIRGINNKDLWIKPQITWIIASYINVSGHFDILDGSKDENIKEGIIPIYRNMDRFFIKLTAMF